MRRRNGFTLIEVLVASLLLGMLVVILTMVFNQSSIAWRTGKASVAEMDEMRQYYSRLQRNADNVLPGVFGTTAGRVCSAWSENGDVRERAVMLIDSSVNLGSMNPVSDRKASYKCPGRSFTLGGGNNYVVGVWSFGPDGKEGTPDDISTWPVDAE